MMPNVRPLFANAYRISQDGVGLQVLHLTRGRDAHGVVAGLGVESDENGNPASTGNVDNLKWPVRYLFGTEETDTLTSVSSGFTNPPLFATTIILWLSMETTTECSKPMLMRFIMM